VKNSITIHTSPCKVASVLRAINIIYFVSRIKSKAIVLEVLLPQLCIVISWNGQKKANDPYYLMTSSEAAESIS